MKQLFLLSAFILLSLSSCQLGKSIGACPNFEGIQESAAMVTGQKRKVKKKRIKASEKLEKKKVKIEEKINLLLGNLDIETVVNHLHKENNRNNWALPDSTCPMVVLKDQSTIYAEVKKMENDTLFLETCDSTQNAFTIPKSTVQSIEYNPEEYDFNKDRAVDLSEYAEGSDYRQAYPDYRYEDLRKAKNMAGWSLGLGLGAILGSIFGIGLILAIPALIFGVLSLRIYKNYPDYREGRGMAVAGKVIGIVLLSLALLVILLFIVFVAPFV